MKSLRLWLMLLLGTCAFCDPALADLKLPALFGDHMMLQRDTPVPVWGWAASGESVTVTAGASTATTKAGADGKWTLRLPALKASATPVELTVAGASSKLVIHDVLVGDVWLASGQSNMGFTLKQASTAAEEVPKANHPEIRIFNVKVAGALEPQSDCQGTWAVCTPDSAQRTTAVGYFFVKEIAETQKIPVGLVNNSVGATSAEWWTGLDALEAEPDLKKAYADPFTQLTANPDAVKKTHDEWLAHGGKDYKDATAKYYADAFNAKAKGLPEPTKPQPPSPEPPHLDDFRLTTALYNGMVAPLMPFSIKGVVWYQGESNGSQGTLYQKLFPAMITGWRKHWGQGDFPFLFVQLPNYHPRQPEPSDGGWTGLREAQLMTLGKVPNAGMAVTIDVGEAGDLHPPNKAPVGHRLALLARHTVYGEKIVADSPLFKSSAVDGSKVVITFDNAGQGLKVSGAGELKGFAIAGADNKFVWAKAKIESANTVSVWSDTVPAPKSIRYGWADNPEVNLCNSADLPASPFRITVN